MLVNLQSYIAVIWLTFLSLVHSLAQPNTLVMTEMKEELKNCQFPPGEVFQQRDDDFMSVCSVSTPMIMNGQPLNYDLKFFFVKYLCMEFFDVSLQLCEFDLTKVYVPKTAVDFKRVSSLPNVETFCSKLNFSDNRSNKTREWADIAINGLKNPEVCEKYCIFENDLNPLCGAISWANELLIALNRPQPAESANEALVSNVNVIEPALPTQKPEPQSKMEDHILPVKKVDSETKSGGIIGLPVENEPKVSIPELNRRLGVAGNELIPNEISSLVGANIGQSENTKETNGRSGEKTSTIASLLLSVPTTISSLSSTGSELLYKAILKEPLDEHEDANSDNFKSRGMGEAASNEGLRPLSDDDNGDVDPKGSNGEDPMPPSVVQEENYEGETDEIPPSIGNSISGLPYDNKVYQDTFVDAQDSHFFAYFLTMVIICIVGYLVFHNKQKIIALALEGRRMQGSRRRPNTSSYKKLDSNLEEAVTSSCSSSSVTHVIF